MLGVGHKDFADRCPLVLLQGDAVEHGLVPLYVYAVVGVLQVLQVVELLLSQLKLTSQTRGFALQLPYFEFQVSSLSLELITSLTQFEDLSLTCG